MTMKILAHARNLQLDLCQEYEILEFMRLDVKLILLDYNAFGKAKHFSWINIFQFYLWVI